MKRILILLFLTLATLACWSQSSVTVPLRPGWNPVAFPCSRVASLEAGPAILGMVSYQGSTSQPGNFTVSEVNAGKGPRRAFWVYAREASSFTFTPGDDGQGARLELDSGWNFVSTAQGRPAPLASLPAGVLSPAYRTNADLSYAAVPLPQTPLEPSTAYWIFASTATTLSWAAPSPSPTPTVVSLRITPHPVSVRRYSNQQLTVTATLQDGSQADVTGRVQWASAVPSAVAVSPSGLLTGLFAGTYEVTATLGAAVTTLSATVVDSPDPPVIPTRTIRLYVSSTQGNAVSSFDLGTNQAPKAGNLAPSTRVTGLSSAEGLFLDRANNELWVGQQVGTTVSAISASATGAAAPLRTLTTPDSPRGVAYDGGRDLLYVSSGSTLRIYTTPRATPALAREVTGLGGSTYGLWLDAASDRLYLVQTNGPARVLILDNASGLNGPLSGLAFRQITAVVSPRGVTVDSTRDRLYVSQDNASVTVFANASTTNLPAAATATLTGAATQLTSDCDGVAIDSAGDELYVGCGTGASRVPIFANASALSGTVNVAPVRVLEGAATLLSGPGGLFLDIR